MEVSVGEQSMESSQPGWKRAINGSIKALGEVYGECRLNCQRRGVLRGREF